MNLYPTILTDSVKIVQDQLNLVKDLQPIKVVQVDVLDGQLADNVTVTPMDLMDLDFGRLQLDFHLMVEEPLNTVHELVECRAWLPVRAVIAQVERMSFQADFLQTVKKEDWLPGLGLDLFTPLTAIDQDSWAQLDIVQLMAVEMGFQGQAFQPRIMDKIKELVKLRSKQGLKFSILIDGGIKANLVTELARVGVDGIAVGSQLWQAQDLPRAVAQLTHTL